LLIPPQKKKFAEWYNNYSGGLRRRLYLGYQIAQSLHILHKDNKAYCDISGNNILVAVDKAKASICMIDIDNLYVPGTDKSGILGTVRYMAPEVTNRQMQPDIFTDDYSLAVILFELLRVGHPYVGDEVLNGTPEMENKAYKGDYPYVDDEEKSFNRSSQMLPAEVVFNPKLKELFKKTFVEGKFNRMSRTTAFEFARACFEAANVLIKCSSCGAWHYPLTRQNNQVICPWCDSGNDIPTFLKFGDDRKLIIRGKEIRESKGLYTYILRASTNDITSNYIFREIKEADFKSYFKIKYAKNQNKYYLLNPDNNEIWFVKAGTTKPKSLTSFDQQVLNRNDILYFGDPSEFETEQNDGKKHKIRRFAQVK